MTSDLDDRGSWKGALLDALLRAEMERFTPVHLLFEGDPRLSARCRARLVGLIALALAEAPSQKLSEIPCDHRQTYRRQDVTAEPVCAHAPPIAGSVGTRPLGPPDDFPKLTPGLCLKAVPTLGVAAA